MTTPGTPEGNFWVGVTVAGWALTLLGIFIGWGIPPTLIAGGLTLIIVASLQIAPRRR